jgi:sorting nexin-17
MHFSIPDTQELNEGNGSTYIGYNIHINGIFHCTVRYKQLHNLHEQLRKEFGNDNLPPFPPKKLLPLTGGQLEERRALLEKYIQTGRCQGMFLVHF